jgi:hypothetical protein
MYSRPPVNAPMSLKPQSSGNMLYIIIIVVSLTLCSISSIVAFFYFNSSYIWNRLF